jgi:hypothetical protein
VKFAEPGTAARGSGPPHQTAGAAVGPPPVLALGGLAAVPWLRLNVRRCSHVFRFLLRLEDGEPPDPAVFVTAVPNWTVGETFPMHHDREFRILEICIQLLPEMLDAGFNGIVVVEPA